MNGKLANPPLLDLPSIGFNFRPASGDAFSIQGSSIWLDTQQQARLTPQSVRDLIATAAKESLAQRTSPNQRILR
jgi:hypothetical protein